MDLIDLLGDTLGPTPLPQLGPPEEQDPGRYDVLNRIGQ